MGEMGTIISDLIRIPDAEVAALLYFVGLLCCFEDDDIELLF